MSTRSLRVGRRTIRVERLDKVLFPDCGVTKGDLIEHYRGHAGRILPYLVERPISMQRFPDGIGGEGFYQKEAPDHFPDWIDTVTVAKQGGEVRQVVCNHAATLVYLANQACITPHPWLSRRDRLEVPDRLVFDLDPPDASGFDAACEGAAALRGLLDELGLVPFLMATGGRGLHVVVPLRRDAQFDAVRAFARGVSELLAEREPEKFTVEMRKDKRRGRVFLDYLRNAYAQTAVAPYTVRARKGAPVATPLSWDELGRDDLRGNRYDTRSIGRRLAQLEDPWKDFRRHARGLDGPREMLQSLLDEDGNGD